MVGYFYTHSTDILLFFPHTFSVENHVWPGPQLPEVWWSWSEQCWCCPEPLSVLQNRVQEAHLEDGENQQTYAGRWKETSWLVVGRRRTWWWLRCGIKVKGVLLVGELWCSIYSPCCSDQLIEDIKFLKDELELKLGQMVPEIDILAALHSRVMNALEVIKKALTISSFCMDER